MLRVWGSMFILQGVYHAGSQLQVCLQHDPPEFQILEQHLNLFWASKTDFLDSAT